MILQRWSVKASESDLGVYLGMTGVSLAVVKDDEARSLFNRVKTGSYHNTCHTVMLHGVCTVQC
jgi:hypothetical protein